MTKFEKVDRALMEKTRNDMQWLGITKNVHAGHDGKYALVNCYTNSTLQISFKTLNEIIKEYDLTI